METGLREATAGPALTGYTHPAAPSSAGELARATLQHLAATQHSLAPVITRAIDDPAHQIRDPVTLTVAALVIIALQTEVKLSRDPKGRWSFTVHKHPMRDSALGQVVTKLLGYLTGGH